MIWYGNYWSVKGGKIELAKILWTPEQLEAINHSKGKLLVSASAGAGKTAVLVERIIKKITDEKTNIDIDQLLVVTFTNAAASEMRDRIRTTVVKQLEEGNTYSKHLERQLTLLNKASIGTIHSFCLEVIKQHFEQLKLDPNFRVANEIETVFLQREVIEGLFEQKYSEGDLGFAYLVECYGGGRSDFMLQDLVLNLYEFARSNPWPEYWLKSIEQNFYIYDNKDIDTLVWTDNLKMGVKLELENVFDSLKRALALTRRPDGPWQYEENILADIVLTEQLIDLCFGTWDGLYKSFNSIEFISLNRCSGDINENIKNQVQDIRNTAKKSINKIAQGLFSRTSEELLSDLNKLSPVISDLINLVIEYGEAYTCAKLSKGLVDFDDLEHYCLQLLLDKDSRPGREIPSEIARELSKNYIEVIIDEYQDINAVQETILNLVATHNNLFMVGDVKQSIYRFRLARPELFLKKHRTYSFDRDAIERKIDLNKNFRSRKEIIDGINFIFRQIMSQQVGEIEYSKQAELYHGADYPMIDLLDGESTVELHLIDLKEELLEEEFDVLDSETEAIDAIRIEARFVAKRIKEMVCEGKENAKPFLIYDRELKDYRPVLYKDIAVLMRTTKNWANIFLDEFHAAEIPAYTETGTGYFEVVEIKTFLSLLKIIDNPRQDIPLAAILRSPIVGLNAEDLGDIRLYCPNGSFYDALKEAAASETGYLNEKLNEFLHNLERWRSLARSSDLATLIWTLYRETGYYDFVGGMPSGRHRQANLRALFDRARQFETTTFRGLFNFLKYIDSIQESGSDLGTAKALGENENVVRIMSIHKSKGLEFPIVFVSGLGKNFNFQDFNKDILFDKDFGLGPAFVDPEMRIKYPTIMKLAIKNKLKFETLAEEMRILYVAMTRAKEKLVLTGTVKDCEKSSARWCQNVDSYEWQLPVGSMANARSYLDWICPALVRHRSGEIIRKLGLCDEPPPEFIKNDSSEWDINIYKYNELDVPLEVNVAAKYEDLIDKVNNFLPLEPQSDFVEIIERNFSWKYPYWDIVGKPVKLAVSQIREATSIAESYGANNKKTKQNFSIKRPKFLQGFEGPLTPTEIGSAVHTVIQHLDLRKGLEEEDIKDQINDMFVQEHITAEQLESINIEWIMDFLGSELGRRILEAKSVRRETPFTIALPISKLYPELAEYTKINESILIQGIIDMLVEENDGFIIIDFKTDKVRGNIDNIVERYKTQIDLYSQAVEIIMGKCVKERYLYLFDINKGVAV